jgi:hypothetical protein
MIYKKGMYCLINKRCVNCNYFFHGSYFFEGISRICRKCKKEKEIQKSKRKKENIDPDKLMDKMKRYRETKLSLDELKPNEHGKVTIMFWTLHHAEQIDYDKAKQMVIEEKAHVYSIDTIYKYNSQPRNRFLRDIVLKRDNNKCYYCGRYGDTIDHIIPISEGGLDILENLVCSCKRCNNFKGNDKDLSLVKIVGDLLTDSHKELKIKEFDDKHKEKTLDDMLNNILNNNKNKWK